MRTTTLGRGGPEVSRAGLGLMGMSGTYGPADDSESIATIHAAVDAGITLYVSSGRKPLRVAPYRDFPRPAVVTGDQIATDGLLAWRLGGHFLHYNLPAAKPFGTLKPLRGSAEAPARKPGWLVAAPGWLAQSSVISASSRWTRPTSVTRDGWRAYR